MNRLNHYLFSISLGMLFLKWNVFNLILIILFTFLINELLDFFHNYKKEKRPWYHRRTWIEEPFGFIFVGLPLAFTLSFINKIFLILILVPYASHIILDYLCIFETFPLAPFSRIKKKEGLGIFIPDDLFVKSENSKKWAKRVKLKKIRGISENYFMIFNLILFILVIFFKII